MAEHYKFIGEDGVDYDVPLGRIVRFENGLSKDANRSIGVWRNPETNELKGQSFEHSSLIPFRQKFRVCEQVEFADPRSREKTFVTHVYCNLATGEWIYTLSTGTEHRESELIGVPKAPTEQPNVVENRDNESQRAVYTALYGGGLNVAYAQAMQDYHAAQIYGNWGPIRDPFREVQAGQQIQVGHAMGMAVPASQMVGRVVQFPTHWADIEMTFDTTIRGAYTSSARVRRNPE